MKFNIIMAIKSLTIIFVSFIFSTSNSFGNDACSNYEDKDCVHPDILKNGHFINQWSVHLPGMTKDEARKLLEDNGFDYLGKILDGTDLYLVTRKGTLEKHALPDEKIIELLKKHEKVHSVAQKHVLPNSQDKMTDTINADDIRIDYLDPNTIILNDGRDNLERIMAFEVAEAVNATVSHDHNEPAKTNGKTEVNGGDQSDPKKKHDGVSSSNNETPSKSSDYENSPKSDLSNKKLLAADLSNKRSADKETSDEQLSSKEFPDKSSSYESKTTTMNENLQNSQSAAV